MAPPPRPRDQLGRPLHADAPGVRGPDPRLDRTPAETVAEAAAWLSRGMPFAAHEVYEDAWKTAAGPERGLWRGLAQLMVAITHARRGNEVGAAALLQRAEESLQPYLAAPPYDLDLTGMLVAARRTANRG